jgi:membrane-bound inhibitor of C-type lysozyme
VQQLNLPTQTVPSMQVIVASGAKLTSDTQVSDLTWWAQGNTFTVSARVLEIPYYDIILGMD